VREDRRAVAFQVFAVLDSGRRFDDQPLEPCLALDEGPRAPVLAVEFEQIEGIEERLAVMRRLCSFSKIAGLVAAHRLAVDRGRAGPQYSHGLADERISVGPIESVASE
jgi:hypothetical protein